jgi:hypothetical protein
MFLCKAVTFWLDLFIYPKCEGRGNPRSIVQAMRKTEQVCVSLFAAFLWLVGTSLSELGQICPK